MNANIAGTTSGDFVGIDINAATVQVTGAGQISLEGHGGDGVSGFQHGVRLQRGGAVFGGSGPVSVSLAEAESPSVMAIKVSA